MDFSELAKNRYSERYFDQRPIEQEKLDKILEAGRVVPTACNYQPQHFYLTVWRNPSDRYYQDYNSGEQDASIVAATMMYEAEELGIHTIWIRGFDSKTVADVYGLP